MSVIKIIFFHLNTENRVKLSTAVGLFRNVSRPTRSTTYHSGPSWRRKFGCLLCFPADVTCVTSRYLRSPLSPTSHIVA